jgi:hypothetical protein
MLLFLGCGSTPSPLQTIELTGSTAEIGRFEGRWFDYGGEMIALVSSQGKPWFGVRLPEGFHPLDASFQKGQLVLHILGEGTTEPVSVRLKLRGDEKAVMAEIPSPELSKLGFICGNALLIPGVALVRDPSPWWHTKRIARDASELMKGSYKRAYDTVWDRLSRIF